MKVLIADDDPSLRFLCRAALEGAGHEVVLAEDGAHVLHRVQQHSPDMLLLDVSMPYMGGLEVLKQMSPDMRDVLPVVLFSARARTVERIEGLEAGAIDYVTKPFLPSALINVVNDVLAMSVEARNRYRMSMLERFRSEQLRESVAGADQSIDLREGAHPILPKDDYSRRAARRQTAAASLALSAVTGATPGQLIDEMVFTMSDVLSVDCVALFEVKSDRKLVCRSVSEHLPANVSVLPGAVVSTDVCLSFLDGNEDVHSIEHDGIFGDGREVWVSVPGSTGRSGVVAVKCGQKHIEDEDVRFVQVGAGIVASALHSPVSRAVRHASFAPFRRSKG
jgi:CheY-like chemotaxis protein